MLLRVRETGNIEIEMDTELLTEKGASVSVNAIVGPVTNIEKDLIGSIVVFEDITSEKRIRNTFGRCLSKKVVDELLSSPKGLQLGGERRDVTFMVSGLRGFTRLSTGFSP